MMTPDHPDNRSALRVAVVGAGPAGLCAARHAQSAGMQCTVFEQSSAVGGTWQYTDCVGTDIYGIPVHTSMYQNLRTNLPKEVVMFPGIPHKPGKECYVPSEEILEYLNHFADMFDLHKLCKFNHLVKRINWTETEWLVNVLDMPKNREQTYHFDVLFICNGRNNSPCIPQVEGAELFMGHSLHSHDYRCPDPFTGQQVLIIGGGPSAVDLANHISPCADKVFLSHHSDWINKEDLMLRDNVVYKTDVRRLGERSVEFVDNSEERIHSVVYCTGFKNNYKFMDESCGIIDDDGMIYPLYKHFINANHQTMCILGNLRYSVQFLTFDIQVRFFIKSLKDNSILPDRDEMLKDIEEYSRKKMMNGTAKKHFFDTTADEDADYYESLAAIARIKPAPRAIIQIFTRSVKQIYFPFSRREQYQLIDDDHFIVSPTA